MTYWQRRAQKISFAVGQILCDHPDRDEWEMRRQLAWRLDGCTEVKQDAAEAARIDIEVFTAESRGALERLRATPRLVKQ